jgi:signal recognition particle subunit SRP54
MLRGRFTLEDFLRQLRMLARMGPLGELIEKLPLAGDLLPEGAAVDARELRRIEAMILSMTRAERARPEVIDASRTARIARGSGTRAEEVQGLLERFRAMQGLLAQIGKAGGLMGRIPGLGRMLGGGGPDLAGLDPASLALGGAPNRRAARAAKALARKQRKAKRRHTRRS